LWNIGSSILRRIRLAILRGILSWLSRIGWRILTSLRIRLRILSRLRIRLRILTTLGIGLRILARLLLRILTSLRIRLRILPRLLLRILATLRIRLRILPRLLLRLLATLRRSRILCRGRRWRCRRTLTLTLRRTHRPIRLKIRVRSPLLRAARNRCRRTDHHLIDNLLHTRCSRNQMLCKVPRRLVPHRPIQRYNTIHSS
jgi:hypothetical protein